MKLEKIWHEIDTKTVKFNEKTKKMQYFSIKKLLKLNEFCIGEKKFLLKKEIINF